MVSAAMKKGRSEGCNMALNKQEIADLYRKRSKRYDFTAQLYYLPGFREYAYREKAVKARAEARGHRCGNRLWHRPQFQAASE